MKELGNLQAENKKNDMLSSITLNFILNLTILFNLSWVVCIEEIFSPLEYTIYVHS